MGFSRFLYFSYTFGIKTINENWLRRSVCTLLADWASSQKQPRLIFNVVLCADYMFKKNNKIIVNYQLSIVNYLPATRMAHFSPFTFHLELWTGNSFALNFELSSSAALNLELAALLPWIRSFAALNLAPWTLNLELPTPLPWTSSSAALNSQLRCFSHPLPSF